MTKTIELTNTNGNKLILYKAENDQLTFNLNVKKFDQSLPDDDGSNAISINLGVERIFKFPFKLLDTSNTSESIDGTGSLYTPAQKQDYIIETFITSGIDDLYTASFYTNNGTISDKTGTIDSLRIDWNFNNPSYVTGEITFKIGGGSQ